MSAEPHRLALLLLAALTATAARAADEQVFEPGSKHVCVPAASGEGWDCRSTDATPPVPAEPEKKSREPRLRSSSQIPDEAPKADTEAATSAPAPASVEPPAATAPPAVAAPPPAVAAPRASSRNVPHYLLAPEARASAPAAAAPAASAPPAAPQSATPAPAAAPAAIESPAPRTSASTAPAREASVQTAPAAAPEPVRTAPASPPPEPIAAAPAAPPAPAPEPPRAAPPAPADPAPAPAAASAPAARDTALLGATEFRRLGDSRYVIELASGNSRSAVESEAGAQTRGEVYLLPLTRDGEAWYVAVWGDFESVDAARSARAEALASGATHVGWPRRVGPLKQELGR
jgi:hypothetical protein